MNSQPNKRAPCSHYAAPGMVANDIRMRLSRTVADDGRRIVVDTISFRQTGTVKYWLITTESHGLRYARVVGNKIVTQKEPFAKEEARP